MSVSYTLYVNASSTTSYEADIRYHKQAKACFDFDTAIKHVLELPEQETCTPTEQLITKVTTPSTTRSDRSDVVLDSQRAKRPARVTCSAKVTTSIESSSSAKTARESQMSLSLREVYEASLRQFIEHEKSFSIGMSQDDWTPSAVDILPTLSAVSADVNPKDDGDGSGDIASGKAQEADTTKVTKDCRAIISKTCKESAEPVFTNLSRMTAREALEYREAQAQIRRMTTHRGLRGSATDASPRHVTNTTESRTVQFETMKLHDFDGKILLAGSEHGTVKAYPTGLLPSPAWSSVILTGSPDPTPPTCVNRYITRPTREAHGESHTPPSDPHTSVPSDKSDRLPLSQGPSSISTVSPIRIKRKRSQEGSFEQYQHERAITRLVTNGTPPDKSADDFILRQLESPFYLPTFQAISKSIGPADGGELSEDEQGRTSISMLQDGTEIMTHRPSHHSYSEQSLAQILGTARAVNETCRTAHNMSDIRVTAGPKATVAAHRPSRAAVVNPLELSVCAPREMNTLGMKDLSFKKPYPLSRPSKLGKPQSRATNAEKADTCAQPTNIKVDNYESCVPEQYQGANPFVLTPMEVNQGPQLMPEFLRGIKTPKKMKRSLRELRPLERGFWSINLQRLEFSMQDAKTLWEDLVRIVTARQLCWVTLQLCTTTLRVYCHGHCVMQIWTLIYASTRRIKKGITWIDAAGHEVLFN